MAELIDKKLVLKEIASFAIGGDPQEEPMANVDHIGMSIDELPTTTESEIRAKAIDEVFEFLKSKRGKKYMRVDFNDLEIREYKEQLKERE